MKKSVNVVALLVFVATNVFTPFSYAVDDENQISPTDILISSEISEPLIVDDEENVGGEEKDIGGEETEKPNVSVETQNNEDGDLEGNKLQILEELKEIVIDPLLMLDRTEEEIVDDSEEITDDMDEEVSESREIYGTGEHKNVKVEVYAETGAFEETPILVIEPLESEKETEIKKAILTYNEDTEELDEEEIEEVAEEKIIEVVAFDIKFLDKEENEVQPREGMVKVEFNFTENEILEETEEHEVKVYHLNDKDEEGNTIDEIKDMEIDEPEVTENKEAEEEIAEEENNEEQIVTVVGDKFSIYTIVQQVKEEGPLAENEDQLANFEYGEISIARPDSLSGEYPDIPGITIMDRNLGAIELYNNDNDYPNEESYGYHYQWGNNYGIPLDATSGDVRVPDPLPRNSSYDNSGYYSTGFLVGPIQGFDVWEGGIPHVGVWGGSGDSGDNSWGLSGINYTDRQGPCPEGWHVPSAGEWGLLVKYWAITSGVNYNGGNYTENGLYNLSEGFENFQNYFRLPLGGFRSSQSAVVYDKGNYGHYRSSSPYWSSSYPYSVTTDYFDSYELSLSSSNVNSNYRYVRGNGRSVRCFKDTYSGTGEIHTITFNFNGGSGSTAAINVLSGEKAIEPSEPVKEGYVFDGWYESDTFQGNKFSFKETVITGGKTLYAKWILENDVAILKTGREFNTIIKTLASGGNNVNYDEKDENIQYFVRYEGNNLPEYKQKISLEGYRDVYAWYSGNNTIYYHTDVETIYLNEDSSYMFYYLKNLKSLNLDDFSTDYVKDMSSMFSHSFSNIDGLTLDFRNLNLSNVSDMSDMFSYSFNTAEYVKHVKLDFSNQNFNNLKDMRRMFEYSFLNAGIVSGVIIDFSSVNLYSIESMESAFAYSFCGTSFEGISIDFSNLFIGTSINMTEMFNFTFKGGNGLMVKGIIIDFSNGNFSGDVNMTRMINNSFNQGNFSISGILIDFNNTNFKSNGNFTSMFATSFSSINGTNGTISFVTIDFSGVHFEGNNNMNYMFQSSFGSVSTASSLSVKFDDVYIGGETNMYGMFQSSFYPGGNLVGVNVSFNNANLSGVVDMSYMFSNAFYFNNVVGVELNFTHVDVSNLRNMEYMFHSIGLRELDLMSFDTRNVINMEYLFSSSQNLKTVYVGNNFTTESLTSSSEMFWGANNLVGGNGTKYTSSHVDGSYANIDTLTQSGYFTDPNNFTVRYLSGDEVVANLTGKVGGTATGLNDGERIYSYYSDSTKNNPYDFEQTLSGYTEIYVSWVDKSQLTLDANGGEITQSQIEADSEGNVTLPNATRGADENGERVFEGWFASTGMSEKIGNSGDVISLTGNMTVYAHWAQTITIWDPANPLSGFTIMDRNLGAITTGYGASASTGSYGFKYQWGNNYGFVDGCWTNECSDNVSLSSVMVSDLGAIWKNIYNNSGYFGSTFIKSNSYPFDYWEANEGYDNLWGGANDSSLSNRGANQTNPTDRQGPCPVGYHVPSAGEWGLLIKYWAETKDDGISENATYADSSEGLYNLSSNYSLFQQKFNLPFAGRRDNTDAYLGNYTYGYYWSSSPNSFKSRYLSLNSTSVSMNNDNNRARAYSVRCFKNEFNAPSMNTITFDAQGGGVETGSISVVSGSTVNLSGYMASMDGWDFTGWNINSGSHEGMDSITVTGDVTLYAIFSKEMTSNFVLRDSNAASLDETTASCTAYNGGYCIVTAPTLTKKSGYTVDGWSADEGNEITTIFTGGNTFNSVTHYDIPVSITFYQNGNGGTGYEVRTCYKYNGAGSCKIRSPKISVPEGFSVLGWSDGPDYNGYFSWNDDSEGNVYGDSSYYAQTFYYVLATFLANNNLVDGGSYVERYCTRVNGAKCYVTTPTITSIGSNTPEIVGYTLSADGVSSADIESNSGLYISGRETYYAHTKKSKVTLVAKWDGNNSTLSSYEDSDCELPEVYDGAAQISGCTVSAPIITAPEATPIVIGFNTGENATTNSDSYNTGNGKLFLTEDSHNQTWYAITYMSGKVLTIDYSIGAGVYSIGKNSDSCTLTGTYNGIAQASSCTVKAPTITVYSGYSDTSKKWTDLSTSNQVAEGEDITLTKDLHYTASAQYQSSTIPETYTITYELNGGTISGEKLVYTVEDPTFTLVNPTWEHHIFAGWTGAGISDPQLVVTISQGTKFENLTYYANWYEDFNDNGINDAIESHFLVKYTDGVDGETVFEDQIFNEVLSGLATPLFVGTPERAGYDFLGWSPEVLEFVLDDVEYVARWNKQSSGGGNSSGGGGKRLPIVDTHGVADDEKASSMDENKEAEEKSETEDSQANQQDQIKNNDGENSQGEDEPDYPDEFVDAYSFSRINGITTVGKIQDAKMYGNLTRIEMAKMLSNYAINVLGKKPDTSKTIKFKDVTNKMDKKYDNGVLLSYQLGIMGINVKNKKFRPNDLVTRAEFATALSRTLFGGEEGKYKSTRKYYEPHIAKLYNEGIINNTDPNMKEKRGYVMIMLMRSVGVK